MYMCFAIELKLHYLLSYKFTSLLCSCCKFKGSSGSILEEFWPDHSYW